MRGNITRRGKSSWRIKFDTGRDPGTGKRKIHLATVHGKRQDAEKELSRLLNASHEGTLVEADRITLAEYLKSWLLGAHGLSGKTVERYLELVDRQINPHLGAHVLQKLRPAHIRDWHEKLILAGGKNGRPLHPRTVGHAHRVLHRGLARALAAETINRNVAAAISPPKVPRTAVESLTGEQMVAMLNGLQDHWLFPIAALALGSGMRRGEILGLRWTDIDLEGATVRVERSVEETNDGLRFKEPKTSFGNRLISLPATSVDALKGHWLKQSELRLALGQGRHAPDALVFCKIDGSPMSPDNLSRDWRAVTDLRKLPRVRFHDLRHAHASALIASGQDVLSVSRRLGHGSPVVTLSVYAHQFHKTDDAAAAAIEAALRTGQKR